MTRQSSTVIRRKVVEEYAKPHPFIDGRQVMYCAACDVQIDLGMSAWEADHRIALALGGSNETDNLVPLCPFCHRRKTSGHDIPVIAKTKRVADRHNGVKRSDRPMPHGKRSKWKRKLTGEVVPRE